MFKIEELKYIGFDFDTKHVLLKKIYDNIMIVLNKTNNTKKYNEDGTLYLLAIARELGDHYKLSRNTILRLVNSSNEKVNYFTIISLLNYIREDEEYTEIKNSITDIILLKFDKFEANNAEYIFLLLDLISCPYYKQQVDDIKESLKLKLLKKLGFINNIDNLEEQKEKLNKIEKFSDKYFYKWKNGNFGKELNTKRGHNVY